jgi:hypothetical protein
LSQAPPFGSAAVAFLILWAIVTDCGVTMSEIGVTALLISGISLVYMLMPCDLRP